MIGVYSSTHAVAKSSPKLVDATDLIALERSYNDFGWGAGA